MAATLHNKTLFRQCALVISSVLLVISASAQAQNDSSFYATYPGKVTGRAYFSNKYTVLKFSSKRDGYNLRYEPNTSINVGIGATYKWATLNLGIGILNRNPERGRSKYLDLQFHNYGRKFTLDILGQFYHGFYLFPKGQGTTDDSFYHRPDLRVNEFGVAFQYIVNNRKFSYRASFLQNERQKKSAGSLLIGFDAYAGRVLADSSIIPKSVNKDAALDNIRLIRFFEIGPNIGYAYTLVVKKNYFLTGAATLSLDVGSTAILSDPGKTRTYGVAPNTLVRFCGGYNSPRWGLSLLYVNNNVKGVTNPQQHLMELNTGNVRIIFVHRFNPNRQEKKALKVIK